MQLSDITIVNADVRRWRKCVSLQASIDRRMEYHYKKHHSELGPQHFRRCAEIQASLNSQLQSDAWEINTNLSSRPILKLSVREVMRWIFAGLPEPGRAQHTDLEKAMVDLMNNKGKEQRAKQHKFALMLELAHKTKQDWYVIFNTLTVRQGAYYVVFNKDSKEFKNYIRQFDRAVNEAETGTRNPTKQRDNHRYFACVEEGGNGGRLHIHVIHLVRTLPRGCNDPNRGRHNPIYREIHTLRKLWNHGWSTPIAARFSPQDAYGKDGWRWPIDTRTSDALVINPPAKLANYMSKYINKGYTSCKRAKLLWRVRKTQNLGRPLLDELTSPLSTNALLLLASDQTIALKLNNQYVPNNLIRLSSLRHLNERYSKNLSDSAAGIGLKAIAKQLSPLPSLLQNLRTSTQTIQTSKQQNTTLILTWITENGGSYEQCRREIEHRTREIDKQYFTRSLHAYGKHSTTDYVHAKSTFTKHSHRSQD